MIEYYHMAQSDNGSLTEANALRRWSTSYISAIESIKDPRAPMQIQTRLSEAGFVNVESKMIPVAVSGWPNSESMTRIESARAETSTGPREKRIGEMLGSVFEATLRSLSLYPLTSKLGISLEEFDSLLTRASEEASDQGLKVYFPL